jgi:hypothetical protein
VKIPYNYKLDPYVTNNNDDGDGGTVYIGEEAKFTTGVGVMARSNVLINNGSPYATITKPTSVTIQYYKRVGGNNGNLVEVKPAKTQAATRFNQQGNLNGFGDETSNNETILVTDDFNVGDQVCVKISVWPSDSHSSYAGQAEGAHVKNADNNHVGDWALVEYGNIKETYSANRITCSTVAKRPTLSVESANAYSANGYNVQRYSKIISPTNAKFTFGSWAEYGVFGKVNSAFGGYAHHLASGAALGYKTDVGNGNQTPNNPRGNDNINAVATENNSNTCVFATQTIVNNNCSSNGTSDNTFGKDSVADYKRRLEERYKTGAAATYTPQRTTGGMCSAASKYAIVVNEGIFQRLVNLTSSTNSAPIIKHSGNIACLDENSFKLEDFKKVSTNNHTLVIDASKGDNSTGRRELVIARDMVLNGDTMNDIGDVYNIIIFADKVSVMSNVKRIDATIIANEVNTCGYNYDGSRMETIGNDVRKLDASKCNEQLVFNAPVITSKIILNRTFGAEKGDNSIKRAEIFNLNMANYLWSFNQMNRYSQAITTYTKEIPSRY